MLLIHICLRYVHLCSVLSMVYGQQTTVDRRQTADRCLLTVVRRETTQL